MKTQRNLNKVITPGRLALAVPQNLPEHAPALRGTIATILACLCALVVAGGCASTTVSDREQLFVGKLPRPGTIWVYDFVATPAEVPADSPLAGQPDANTTPQTAQQTAEGRKLGAEIATELVAQIQTMGLAATKPATGTKPRVNDLVIRGYLLSIVEGSAAKRVAIGLGSGASELKAVVDGYQMTAKGLRKLGSGTVQAEGSQSPGAGLGPVGLLATGNPAGLIVSSGMKVVGEETGSSKVEGRADATAKEISDVLKQRFQQEGWIAQ
jgi:hypothetical protein